MLALLTFQSLAGRCFTLLSRTLEILHPNKSWSHPVELLPLCILIYSGFADADAGTLTGVALTPTWRRHNVLAVGTCMTCDITSPGLWRVFSCCILTGCFFKRCLGLILGFVLFFFKPWEKMFLHFTGCFDVLKGVCVWGGGVIFHRAKINRAVSLQTCNLF